MSAIVDAQCAGSTRVSLKVSLVFSEDSSSEPLTLPGRVVWCTELDSGRFQIGMAFLSLTGEQLGYLDIFMRYLEDAADERLHLG